MLCVSFDACADRFLAITERKNAAKEWGVLATSGGLWICESLSHSRCWKPLDLY